MLTEILGFMGEPPLAARLQQISQHGRIEYLRIPPRDIGRHRLRITSDRGTDCAVALSRNTRLVNGAVLLLEQHRAIVACSGEPAWLRVRPADTRAALELGYLAGHMHWKVQFDGADLLVTRDSPTAFYTERIEPLLTSVRVSVIDEG